MKPNLLVFSAILLAQVSFQASAQTTLVKTESAFGTRFMFEDSKSYGTFRSADGKVIHIKVGDSPGYDYKKIDDCGLNVKYDCFLAFNDNHEEGIEGEMLLQVGTGHTKFCSSLLYQADSIMQAEMNPHISTLLDHANPVFHHDAYYTDLQTGEITFVCRFATEDFKYVETPPAINWDITDETMEIRGHSCRKATGGFRGRIYEAWFTEDFPVSAGPWKLRGLPGVILYAKDSEGLASCMAVSVEEGGGDIEMAEYPYIETSRKKHASMLKQLFKSPDKFTSMHMSRAQGITITLNGKDEPLRGVTFLEKD